MKLSQNFSLEELVKSQTAIRSGIDNTPNDEAVESLQLLAEKVLQPIRDHYGKPVTINSGYRGPKLNESIGGSKTSDHCLGRAADIEIPGVSNHDVAHWIKDNLEFTQLILEGFTQGNPSSGWVHVSYNPKDLKKQVLTATFVNGKASYTNGINV